MLGLTIDPGKETGICFWSGTDVGFQVHARWQFPGGADALHEWLESSVIRVGSRIAYGSSSSYSPLVIDALVVEKFTPHDSEGFSLTLDSVEPLVCEGVLIAHGLRPFISWAQPSQQYFMGGSTLTLAEKKKAARKFLETYDLLPTGKEFGRKDAKDAISATLHSIAYLRRARHMPTMHQLFDN